MYRVIFSALLLCIASVVTAQPAEVLWTQIYGGTGSDRIWSIQETTDQGFVMAGSRQPMGGADDSDIWLIKVDADGNEVWSHEYGGPHHEACYRVRSAGTDGFVLAGMTDSTDWDNGDCWGVRIDASGDTLWTIVFSQPGNGSFVSVRELQDNGFVFVGANYNPDRQAVAVRTNVAGEILWSQTYGGIGEEQFSDVIEVPDGGFLFTGLTNSWGSGGRDIYAVRADADGNSIWQNFYGGTGNDWSFKAEAADEGYIMTGAWGSSPAEGSDACLVKISETGDLLWYRVYGGWSYETALDFRILPDGLMVSAQTCSWGEGAMSSWLIKTDTEGFAIWNYIVPDPGTQWCMSGVQTPGGNYVLAGTTDYDTNGDLDGYLIKIAIQPDCQPQTATLIPEQLNFGVVDEGETSSLFFSISNLDTCDLIVNSISQGQGFSAVFTGPQTIPQGESRAIEVRFAPQEVRAYNDELSIHTNAADSPTLLPVSGIGGGPLLSVDPDPLEFGDVQVGTSGLLNLVLTNSGTSDLTISEIYVPRVFSTDFEGPVVLNAGQNSTVSVSFTPDSVRTYEDVLVIISNLSPSLTPVILRGTGIPSDANDSRGSHVSEFELSSVYPNPFNPATTVSFAVPHVSDVTLVVYDVLGRQTEILLDGVVSAGRHQVQWTCPDCAAGVYLIEMQSGEFHSVAKAVFLK